MGLTLNYSAGHRIEDSHQTVSEFLFTLKKVNESCRWDGFKGQWVIQEYDPGKQVQTSRTYLPFISEKTYLKWPLLEKILSHR